MKITHVESYPVRIPLKPEFHMITALGLHDVSNYVVVRVGTDSGIDGAGEATVSLLWSGESVWGCKYLLDRVLGPAVMGLDPTDIATLAKKMDQVVQLNWFAKSAIEMACWDIAGKAANKPVYELLGGAKRSLAIRGRFSMGAFDVERARRRAAELVAMGFNTIKVKVGGDPAKDIARVRGVRDVIGGERGLVIDANCGWDADTAVRCVTELEDCNLSLVEQPTPDGDYAALARVRRASKAPVMADDMCFDLVHARELVRNQACDVISVYPGKNGGIAKSKQIVEYAGANNVACSIGSNLELEIGTAAMGHLVVACENMRVEKFPGDIYGPIYHAIRIAKNPLNIQGPITEINSQPGLGVDVDWELVRTLGR